MNVLLCADDDYTIHVCIYRRGERYTGSRKSKTLRKHYTLCSEKQEHSVYMLCVRDFMLCARDFISAGHVFHFSSPTIINITHFHEHSYMVL